MNVELRIIKEYATEALVARARAKLGVELLGRVGVTLEYEDTFSRRLLRELEREHRAEVAERLPRIVFADLVLDHALKIVTEFGYPTIDFEKLRRLCVARVKEISPDLF